MALPYLIIIGIRLSIPYIPFIIRGIHHAYRVALAGGGATRTIFQSVVQNGRLLTVVHRNLTYTVKLLNSGRVSIMGPNGANNIPPKLIQGVTELVQKGQGFSGLYHPTAKATEAAGTLTGQIFFKGPW